MRRTQFLQKNYTFTPKFSTVAKFSGVTTTQAFQFERSMYSATVEFVKKHGGPMSQLLLTKIPQEYYDEARSMGLLPNIDIRVHKFDSDFFNTPGLKLYPAIPGWHCDGEWRETYFSQPDLDKIPVSHHLIATIASEKGISNTQFLLDSLDFSAPEKKVSSEHTLWEQVDLLLRNNPSLRLAKMPDGEMTLFDARSLHEATPVNFPGHRLFFRCSMWHKPNLGDGQLSLNEQLYTVFDPTNDQAAEQETKEVISAPQYQVLDRVNPVVSIDELAKEPGIIGGDTNFIQAHGGPISNALLKAVPSTFFEEARKQELQPKIDFHVFRLYPSYQPNFPGYDKKIRLSGWHLPVPHRKISLASTPEVHVSLSTCEEGVNKTQFLVEDKKTVVPIEENDHLFWSHYNKSLETVTKKQSDKAVITQEDGDIVLTSSHTPRRELPALRRGWRGLFRIRMDKSSNVGGELVKQQYVSIPHRGKGW